MRQLGEASQGLEVLEALEVQRQDPREAFQPNLLLGFLVVVVVVVVVVAVARIDQPLTPPITTPTRVFSVKHAQQGISQGKGIFTVPYRRTHATAQESERAEKTKQ